MKVLLINGSHNVHGCTDMALQLIAKELKANDVESEIVWIGNDPIQDFGGKHDSDIVNVIGEKMKDCDGLIVGSPTWYAHPTGRLLCLLDRLSTEYGPYLAHKPASSIMSARRAGQVIGNDIINKHFGINNMPIVSSTYWNLVFGSKPEEVLQDEEGVDTMINLARNMAWVIKCINAGKEKGVSVPDTPKVKTNFHR